MRGQRAATAPAFGRAGREFVGSHSAFLSTETDGDEGEHGIDREQQDRGC